MLLFWTKLVLLAKRLATYNCYSSSKNCFGSMGSCSTFIQFVLMMSLLLVCDSAPLPKQHSLQCHDYERSVLLQFKEGFTVSRSASSDPSGYPKLSSWTGGEESDCCLWDGVECDNATGHVISLDLTSSFLNGSIGYNSSLFQLDHLRSLSLSDNNFNSFPVPAPLANFSQLTSLNLSSSFFSGKIPSSLSQLSRLAFLDLSNNSGLILEKTDFENLVINLTELVDLRLDYVNILSSVPLVLTNLSSLKSLQLRGCGLSSEFPVGVFMLPNLEILDLDLNSDLEGHLPEFNSSSPLQLLSLAQTRFSGKLPPSIGNLGSLAGLDVQKSSFSGKIPSSIGNLTQLSFLDLSNNQFEGQNFSSLLWVGKLTKLQDFGLNEISFSGEMPSYFANLSQLTNLYLSGCQLSGQIPPWLAAMDQLRILVLLFNKLEGPIPTSFFSLKNLKILDLSQNNLSGTVELGKFLELKNLHILKLSQNNLILLDNVNPNAPIQPFTTLGFGSCNLEHFPSFLQNQGQLKSLDLSKNNIHGQIPRWIWNASIYTLEFIDLSHNFLTDFELNPLVLPWAKISYIDLSFNMLQGLLPIPQPSTLFYYVSRNSFSGEVPPLFCSLNSLYGLDLSANNFTGIVPECLGNLSASIEVLLLSGNKFQGKVPEIYTDECNIKILKLDVNQLTGRLPRSLSKCTKLQFLSLERNQINDIFPFWLGTLQELQVFVLKSNQFYGVLDAPFVGSNFPSLRIIDLSWNNFSGQLPTQYFSNLKGMKIVDRDQLTYMMALITLDLPGGFLTTTNVFTLSLANKGVEQDYERVQEALVAIDFSSNGFEGNIPETIGDLTGLRLLNLSNNLLSGQIPSSLSNISVLESLDLSSNHLSGEIPEQLTQLNFLVVFDVANNNLTGPIPQGNQFDTFENTSYTGNLGLCGNTLLTKCGAVNTAVKPQSPPRVDEDDSLSIFGFGWRPTAIGFGSGIAVGVVIGHVVIPRFFAWLSRASRLRRQRTRSGSTSRTSVS